MSEYDILKLIQEDTWMMQVLQAAKTLDLPDWWIGAGFIRSKIWDALHTYKNRTPLPDIDVIYFDPTDFTSKEAPLETIPSEIHYEQRLKQLIPDLSWSVTNQARMHLFHDDKPYANSEEALSKWVETATCIGVKLEENNELLLTAPYGIDDLVNLIIRPTPTFKSNTEEFLLRAKRKNWLTKWPKLKIQLE